MCECGCSCNSDAVVLRVEGMTCAHCKSAAEKAVNALPGVSSAEVNLDEKTLTVKFDSNTVGLDAIKKAIVDAGYEVA